MSHCKTILYRCHKHRKHSYVYRICFILYPKPEATENGVSA
jgi:hypothetical protein